MTGQNRDEERGRPELRSVARFAVGQPPRLLVPSTGPRALLAGTNLPCYGLLPLPGWRETHRLVPAVTSSTRESYLLPKDHAIR